MMGLFIWGKLRYDVVAALALLAALVAGIVPYDKAFIGFSDDIVIIIGSALVVSAAVARSGIVEAALARYGSGIVSIRAQMFVLVAAVALLSGFVKNIGALAIMIPIAFQMARRSNVSPSRFLMPMAFGALLGGLVTQIGTSPNIIVSRLRGEMTGSPFTMFDFAPVGLILTAVGLVFLTLFYRLLPERHGVSGTMDEALDIDNYTTEAEVTSESAVLGKTVADLHALSEGEAHVTAIVRGDDRRTKPLPDAVLQRGDILLIEGDPQSLDRSVSGGKLKLHANDKRQKREPDEDFGSIEAVIGQTSPLIGLTAQNLAMSERFGVNLLAVSRTGQRIDERLGEVILRFGDVLVLQGNLKSLPEKLRDFGCLPLAERSIRLGDVRAAIVPVLILVAAMGLTAFGIVPVAIAFFAAAVGMVVFKAIPMREAYESVEWPILIMLAALIPVSESLSSTGGTVLIADWLSHIARQLPPYGALTLILVAAMAVTPFLNNAATVLVMAPIAATFATELGFRPDAFLMAVAIGAGCDFLTPVGHQCNTLVMGPGGYKFTDYSRLGLPLSLLVVVVGVPAIMWVWPLR
ncbi:MAG: SLC13 family permease [Parvibaculum sp.]|uniref:SLC13 family permease n=1 Tax=Parvibaculum sp. TaxID=2024848 RepID=UPI0025D2A9F8|nr:SLC13 family permease [Parvibaculum sp.]MCE9650786.1 SLC13 family permease [Parvibaculum sp.]